MACHSKISTQQMNLTQAVYHRRVLTSAFLLSWQMPISENGIPLVAYISANRVIATRLFARPF